MATERDVKQCHIEKLCTDERLNILFGEDVEAYEDYCAESHCACGHSFLMHGGLVHACLLCECVKYHFVR
jgi:hypothetical protein